MLSTLLRNGTRTAGCNHNIPSLGHKSFLRLFSSLSKPVGVVSNKISDTGDKAKNRRRYAIAGCIVFMFLSTNGLLLYRRRDQHRYLTKKIPSISWEDFVENYLTRGLVKTIIYQPQYETGNVYLHSTPEKLSKKTFLDRTHFSTAKFPHPPNIRFTFHGDETALKKALLDHQSTSSNSSSPLKAVEFKIDEFPNYWEMAFIAISAFLTLAVVSLTK